METGGGGREDGAAVSMTPDGGGTLAGGALEDRLLELEAKLALSEDMQEALNTALYRQQQHIDRLERELRALRDQVESAAAAGDPLTPRDEVPPHY